MSYQTFEAAWIGKRVDYDHIFGYQCVDEIKQYCYQEFGMSPGAWGDAKDYWLNTKPVLLTRFDKIQTTDVKAGDIVPLKPNHIGIATGAQTADSVEILEQNGSTGNGTGLGKDAIRKRFVLKSRMYGVLRPKSSTPAPHTERVAAGTWNVRRSPDLGGAIMGVVKGGEVYETAVLATGWRRITYKGAVGYVGPKAWQ